MAPGPGSLLTTACVAALGSYGWWSTSVETATQQVQAASCEVGGTTVPGAVEACLAPAANAAATEVEAGHGRSNSVKAESKFSPLSKALLFLFLFVLEGTFLYGACHHLKIPKKHRWLQKSQQKLQKSQHVITARGFMDKSNSQNRQVAGTETLEGEDDLPEDLGNLQPSLQPESLNLDARLPVFGDSLDKDVAGEAPQELGSICDEASKLAESTNSEEALLKGASPLRHRTANYSSVALRGASEVAEPQDVWH